MYEQAPRQEIDEMCVKDLYDSFTKKNEAHNIGLSRIITELTHKNTYEAIGGDDLRTRGHQGDIDLKKSCMDLYLSSENRFELKFLDDLEIDTPERIIRLEGKPPITINEDEIHRVSNIDDYMALSYMYLKADCESDLCSSFRGIQGHYDFAATKPIANALNYIVCDIIEQSLKRKGDTLKIDKEKDILKKYITHRHKADLELVKDLKLEEHEINNIMIDMDEKTDLFLADTPLEEIKTPRDILELYYREKTKK